MTSSKEKEAPLPGTRSSVSEVGASRGGGRSGRSDARSGHFAD